MMRAMPALFHRLPRNLVSIFSGRNLVWHALAIALTAGIVMSGGDWAYYRATRRVIFLRAAIPAIGLGTLLPVLLPLGLLVAGAIEKKRRLVTTGWALGQSALLAWMVASAYKALTGRAPPPMDWRWGTSGAGSLIDTSHGFRLGSCGAGFSGAGHRGIRRWHSRRCYVWLRFIPRTSRWFSLRCSMRFTWG